MVASPFESMLNVEVNCGISAVQSLSYLVKAKVISKLGFFGSTITWFFSNLNSL